MSVENSVVTVTVGKKPVFCYPLNQQGRDYLKEHPQPCITLDDEPDVQTVMSLLMMQGIEPELGMTWISLRNILLGKEEQLRFSFMENR